MEKNELDFGCLICGRINCKKPVQEILEEVINSPEFFDFCNSRCPMEARGCRHYCPTFTFRAKLEETNE